MKKTMTILRSFRKLYRKVRSRLSNNFQTSSETGKWKLSDCNRLFRRKSVI